MGTLFLVATPIGNLDDISARARRVLSEVSLIAAEDTRHTGRLLSKFGIETPLISYHAHNQRSRRDQLLAALAEGDVALVSDAGSPGLSDPGYDLVVAAIEAGLAVSPVPGPSAAIAAATISGIVPGPFVVLGFLPRRGEERRSSITRARSSGYPLVIYEAPGRLAATLDELGRTIGDRPAIVARELTKRYESVYRGTLSSLAQTFSDEPPKGETVIVVGAGESTPMTDSAVDDLLRTLIAERRSLSDTARTAASATGRPRSELYDRARLLQSIRDADRRPVAGSDGAEGRS
jgi:16S rRNA (cytidine1402-2'-O)-methyltransferase